MTDERKRRAREHRVANPDYARAMHGLRSSSAASPHIPTPRKGTRGERARREIAEQRDDRT